MSEEQGQRPVEDFPDVNLDVLRERTASMQPGRHELTDDNKPQQVALPPEPTGRVVVEAVNDQGGMQKAYWPYRGGWVHSIGPLYDTDTPKAGEQRLTWAEVVAFAIAARWRLFICKQGGAP